MRGASGPRWCAKLAPKGVAVPMARVTRARMRTAGCVRLGLTWPTALSEDAAPPGAPDPVVATGSLRSVRLPCGLSLSWCSPKAAVAVVRYEVPAGLGLNGTYSTLGAAVQGPCATSGFPPGGSARARAHSDMVDAQSGPCTREAFAPGARPFGRGRCIVLASCAGGVYADLRQRAPTSSRSPWHQVPPTSSRWSKTWTRARLRRSP